MRQNKTKVGLKGFMLSFTSIPAICQNKTKVGLKDKQEIAQNETAYLSE